MYVSMTLQKLYLSLILVNIMLFNLTKRLVLKRIV